MNNFSNLKICEIEKLEGIKYETCDDINKYSLPKWYDRTRNKKVNELDINDIAISIRQEIFLIYIIPEALKRLNNDPTIGDQYYGEVLTTLYKTDKMFWKNNVNLLEETKSLLDEILSGKLVPNDFEWMYSEQEHEFYNIVDEFLKKLNTVKAE